MIWKINCLSFTIQIVGYSYSFLDCLNECQVKIKLYHEYWRVLIFFIILFMRMIVI